MEIGRRGSSGLLGEDEGDCGDTGLASTGRKTATIQRLGLDLAHLTSTQTFSAQAL